MAKSTYVIVGNSAAAVGAVEAIREVDREKSITIISDESHFAYSRPLITYYLAGQVKIKNVNYRPKSFYANNQVEALLSQRVTDIDPENSEITLQNKKKIKWEKLLLATGGTPFVPPLPGSDMQGVHTFTTLEDARKVNRLLANVKEAVVIGGGLIGLKVTEALAMRDVKVTVVELADRVLSPVLDAYASKIVEDIFRKKNVTILTGRTVKEILESKENSGSAGRVMLDDGREIPCKLVIVAIGVVPRTELAKDKLKINRGILVDEHMATSTNGIYAAGDVTEAYDFLWEQPRVTPIWPDAYLQGRIAGFNMAGCKTEYPGSMGMNSTTFFGFPIISAGLCNLDDQERFEVLSKKDGNGFYRKLVLEEGLLKGMILAGKIERAGIILNFIKDGLSVHKFKRTLLSDNFGFVSLPNKVRKERLAVRS